MSEKQNTVIPKWPFLGGDIILVLLACFIVIASPKPMTAIAIFACALSVILGMLVYVTPFIIEHLTQQQRVKLKQAKAGETLLKAVELASDLLNRTESIHAELMKGVLGVKQVPAKLEEKTEELMELLDSDKLTSSVTELSDLLNRLETLPNKTISNSESSLSITKIEELLEKQIIQSESQIAAINDSIEQSLEEIRNELLEKLGDLDSRALSTTLPEDEPDTEILESLLEKTEPEKVTKPKETAPEPSGEAEAVKDVEEVDGTNIFEEEDDDAADAMEVASLEEPEVLQDKKPLSFGESGGEIVIKESEDGTTRLIVGAFIGISNKLYIRGEGPGLDWDKGVPMELVGIGKWEWKTNDAHSTIRCKVLINDEQWTDSENFEIEPNTTVETTASF